MCKNLLSFADVFRLSNMQIKSFDDAFLLLCKLAFVDLEQPQFESQQSSVIACPKCT